MIRGFTPGWVRGMIECTPWSICVVRAVGMTEFCGSLLHVRVSVKRDAGICREVVIEDVRKRRYVRKGDGAYCNVEGLKRGGTEVCGEEKGKDCVCA